MNKEAKLVSVFTTQNAMEASVVKGLLESIGIPSILKPAGSPSVFPFSVDGLGITEVLVHQQNAARAVEIIEADYSDAKMAG